LKLQACKPTTTKKLSFNKLLFSIGAIKKNQIAKDFSNKKLISILPSLK
jgi:hypothetical protein